MEVNPADSYLMTETRIGEFRCKPGDPVLDEGVSVCFYLQDVCAGVFAERRLLYLDILLFSERARSSARAARLER